MNQREREEVKRVLAVELRVGKKSLKEELRRESYEQGGKGPWLGGGGELVIRQLLLFNVSLVEGKN
jgi:hypothetical protein